MPGSRLGYDERQRIAAGLADGLGYAEIARRLGRPTSTVSREVNRCGGPAAYRADRAQVTTRRRARRFGTSETSTTEAGATVVGATNERDVREFEEQFGALMIRTGLPRMPARVLACLLTSTEEGLYATELAERLRVSPASISRATDILERVALVNRHRDPARGRARYSVTEDIWDRALRNEAEICAEWAATARRGAGLLAESPAGERLHEMARFLDLVGRDLARIADHWHRPPQPGRKPTR